MATVSYLTDEEIKRLKREKRDKTAKKIISYYRQNPHRLATEYLKLNLYWFQKILIYAMAFNDYFMFLASRSIGKTYLTAIFCVVYAILYPNSKIVVAAGTKQQACEILSKIEMELMPASAMLRKEIDNINPNPSKGICKFKNNSYIKAVASSDSARGNRATVLICDEFRMIKKSVIDTVLKKFIGALREPLFLKKFTSDKEKAKYKEEGKEIYMSSAWYTTHWSYKKALEFLDKMIKGHKYFICALPYQLQLQVGMISEKRIRDEMSETSFDQISFDIESSCIFYGSRDGKFFKEESIDKNRILLSALPPSRDVLYGSAVVPDLEIGERRILSVDVALMASKKNKDNDAASIQINRAMPNGNRLVANLAFLENHEGLLTQELGRMILKYFYEYKCTDIVLDGRSMGISVYDYLIEDYYDNASGNLYKAVRACNNKDYEERCKDPEAEPVVWIILGSPSFNSEAAHLLRSGLQNGQVKLLVDEFKAEEHFKKSKSFNLLSEVEQSAILSPYRQTTLLKHELISLVSETNGSVVKIKELSGMRKDRYSSLSYNYHVMKQIEQSIGNDNDYDSEYDDFDEIFVRKPVVM